MLQEDAPARPPLREVELDDPALVLRLHRPAHRVDEARVGHPRAQHVRVEAGAHDGAHERRVVDRGDPLTLALHRFPCAAGEAEVGQHAAELLAQRVQLSSATCERKCSSQKRRPAPPPPARLAPRQPS